MKWLPLFLLLLCAACQAPSGASNSSNESDDPDTFGENDESEPESIEEREGVARFRGVEMPKLLERLESGGPGQWAAVRSHVAPPPQPPREGSRANYPWPPADWNELSPKQQAWRDYARWPEHIRALLQQEMVMRENEVVQPAWDSLQVRSRLVRYGRMYRLLHEFQTARAPGGARAEARQREAWHWKEFAESMLAYGDDGRELLVANMILALTSPEPHVVVHAQDVLVGVGEPAIGALCAALWTGHNQLVRVEFEDGRTELRVQTNAKFPQYVIDCLYRIGPPSVRRAWYELKTGPTEGTAWRFRKNFVELLGMFRDPGSVKPLEAELDVVKIVELDREALQRGEQVVDRDATDHAQFVYREYLLKALGDIGAAEGLRALVRIWKTDESHEDGATEAVFRISGRRVRTIEEAREVARAKKVDLQGH